MEKQRNNKSKKLQRDKIQVSSIKNAYKIELTSQFKRDLKLCNRRGYDIDMLENIVDKLQNKIRLEKECKPHILEPKSKKIWECHVTSDWLLVYVYDKDTLILLNTGTHSDLF